MKGDYPYPVDRYKFRTTLCFFFYSNGYLSKTFYCEVTGLGKQLLSTDINCYPYPCNDIGRSDDWEWVNVN